ncbi:MAG: MBOAT family O-acyltransferase, partial [Melioribacteraceae bacterium]
DRIFDYPLRYTGVENLLALYGYVLQIYCDFSGYSDMAIGVALLLGFKLMDNFNYPFKATSIADFWRRWHISLSKWLLDYLFKPIQISSRSLRIFGNVIALVVTFFVCGLWHGAGWNFILWGVFHGALMSISLFFKKPKDKFYKFLRIYDTKFLKVFQTVVTFHVVAFSFLIFRSQEMQNVEDMILQIYQYFHAEVFLQFAEKLPLILGLIFIGYLFHFLPARLGVWIQKIITMMPLPVKILFFVVVVWIVAQFKSADIQPFIYFQF